jgi:hypothetical protein
VESRYYLLEKNFPHTLKHTLAFWWSIVAYLVQATLSLNKENVKGVITGLSDIKGLQQVSIKELGSTDAPMFKFLYFLIDPAIILGLLLRSI